MDLRRLAHFVAVAEERNFTRAAARLHIVQSGISSSIRALERELGTALFDRTTQHVELTEAGHALLPHARRLLSGATAARQAVDQAKGGLTGRLHLGILYGYTPAAIPARLAAFRAGHPEVVVRMRGPGEHGTTDHVRALCEGTLDLAFVMVTGPVPGLDLHVLTTETVLLACHPAHRPEWGDRVDPADLVSEPLIDFPPGWGVRNAVDRTFAAAGVERRATLEINDITTILDLVRHRLGIAFVPGFLAAEAPDLRFLATTEHQPAFQVALAAPTDRPLTPVARAFLGAVAGDGPRPVRSGPP
ncbi:LysR family transcriptional regulator [Saccharothrix variisporea]|uniref:DNA-binding transcriptional LysR family regulator n=1 Tax=Saccharothrix variisporea TaxID=543527 RepID=A0A495X550_9PSEU|nr:LysR family transcriptional regulator [Saccharothrix variisporea]RKT69130.1 DNA-binding transcriptional LysR family regulator [Saccharothrix variisporea]